MDFEVRIFDWTTLQKRSKGISCSQRVSVRCEDPDKEAGSRSSGANNFMSRVEQAYCSVHIHQLGSAGSRILDEPGPTVQTGGCSVAVPPIHDVRYTCCPPFLACSRSLALLVLRRVLWSDWSCRARGQVCRLREKISGGRVCRVVIVAAWTHAQSTRVRTAKMLYRTCDRECKGKGRGLASSNARRKLDAVGWRWP